MQVAPETGGVLLWLVHVVDVQCRIGVGSESRQLVCEKSQGFAVFGVVRNQFVLVCRLALFLLAVPPDEALQPGSFRLCPECTEELAQHLETVRSDRKIDFGTREN